MEKIDFKKQSIPFTQVANDVLSDKKVSFEAKGLYAYLYSKPDGWNFNYIRIAEDTKESKNTVLKILHELEESGYLIRHRLASGRMVYQIIFPPIKPLTKSRVEGKKPLTKKATDQNSQVGVLGHISNKDGESNKENTSNKEELPEWINKEVWKNWEGYRKEKKQKLTPRSITLQLKYLEQHKDTHVAIIEQSIQNGWTGLFPLKVDNVISNQPVRVLKFK